MDKASVDALKDKAFDIRCSTIRCIASFGSGHIGGSMSIVEILTYLYYKEMDTDPSDPKRFDRDRLVVSKGHAGPAVYATLASKGFFPESWLKTLNQGGTNLPSHCDMTKTPGVDFTGGSLGQGFSAAVGIALGQRVHKLSSRTFTIIGDGESQEGQIWEAAESAGAWKLDNLFAFLDLNGQQLDGYTKDIIPQIHIPERWASFGWDVHEINGHDFNEIEKAIEDSKKVSGMPHMIVMNTIKSYGYIPGEGIKSNHSMPITPEGAEEAIKALAEREGRV
ncbi:MAG: transketolase [Spirochaetes bacterium]|uniref:Transketolase n=1 Tax=Candidatus Ornithospirochaeta stercoripullorum TaxID=2840899 RepID=A0A9D9DZM1_9SPIO|nr:transketolase [Candidatus Ornithospirochaeta stercoripullorum]